AQAFAFAGFDREGEAAFLAEQAGNLGENFVQFPYVDKHIGGDDEVGRGGSAAQPGQQVVLADLAVEAALGGLLHHGGGDVDAVDGVANLLQQRGAQAGAAAEIEGAGVAAAFFEQGLEQGAVGGVVEGFDQV